MKLLQYAEICQFFKTGIGPVDKNLFLIFVPLKEVYVFDNIHVIVGIRTFRIMCVSGTSLQHQCWLTNSVFNLPLKKCYWSGAWVTVWLEILGWLKGTCKDKTSSLNICVFTTKSSICKIENIQILQGNSSLFFAVQVLFLSPENVLINIT